MGPESFTHVDNQLIHNSDRGIQYCCDDYQTRIAPHHSSRCSPVTPDPDNSVYWAEPHATINKAGNKIVSGSNKTIQNLTVGARQAKCYNASNTLEVAGNGSPFLVQSTGTASLIAGGKINL